MVAGRDKRAISGANSVTIAIADVGKLTGAGMKARILEDRLKEGGFKVGTCRGQSVGGGNKKLWGGVEKRKSGSRDGFYGV